MTNARHLLSLPIISLFATSQLFGATRAQFLLEEGEELYKAQQYEAAIAQFDRVLKLDPSSWSANYLTAVSYIALYHPGSEFPKDREYAEKGIAAFERALELTPPSPEEGQKAERYYLSFLDATGDKDKAIAYLEQQLSSRPNDPALLIETAMVYQKKGEFSKALEYFEKRANVDSNNKEAWYTLGVNCWARSYNGGPALPQEEREQVVAKGIQAMDTALEIDPDYFDALAYINLLYREKAKVLDAVDKSAEAQEAYEKAAEYQMRAIEVRKSQIAKQKAASAGSQPESP